MRRSKSVVIILLLFMLGFGCLSEKAYTGGKSENIALSQGTDLDGDGNYDYIVYGFSPSVYKDAGMQVERQVTVSVETTGVYTGITPNLTDVDLLVADQSLDEFSKSRTQADTACSQAIGLSNVVCSDVTTCSRLCSSASVKCKRIAAAHEEVLAGSMISYVKSNNEIRSHLLDARRMVLGLREGTDQERDEFLGKTRDIVARVAEINANPLYTNSNVGLCSHSDFGILPYLVEAAQKVGPYTTQNASYKYHVLLSVKPQQQKSTQELGVEVAGVTVSDSIPASAVLDMESVSSIQAIAATEVGNNVRVDWDSVKTSKEGYLLYYEFRSDQPPEAVIPAMKSPELAVREINLVPLVPTNTMLFTIYEKTGSYFISYGAALGLTLGMVFFAYTAFILAFTMVSEKAAGASFTTGFRKAFGRTDVRWRTDIVVAIVFLVVGVYIGTAMTTQPVAPPTLLESFDFLITNDTGVISIGLTMIGTLMFYFAVENFLKITILERAYGMVIRQEKDLFLAKAGTLKERLKELEALVEEYSKEDFDVSKEYDVLTTIKADKVDVLTKDMGARSKALIDDYMARVENGLASLKGRKKLADENWPRWRDNIAKMLDEQGEVYVSSLITVPASLRGWALGRYAKEAGADGLSFERDAIKKRKVSPEQLVQDLVAKGMIKGAIVMKQDKVISADFSEGGTTVMTALGLKLMTYLRSLARNLGQHQPQSYAALGGRIVIVMMKSRAHDSVLFISKDKFKDAVEQWKAKMKAFEAS